jgi:hypothetical protein
MANNNVLISIDSRFRDKSLFKNSGKFTYFSPNTYKSVISIKIVSIEFPNLFYTFTKIKQNISFYIATNTISPYKIQIKEGNYTSSQIIDELNSKFSILKSASGLDIIASLDTVTGKTMIKSVGSIFFSLNFTNSNLGKHLGYNENIYENLNQYESEGIMDIVGDPYFYVNINDWGDLVTQLGNRNILGKVILNKSKTVMVFDNQANFLAKTFTFVNPTTVNKLNIELLDINGITIDMVNLDYSLTLELKMVFDNSKIGYYDSLKNNF